MKSLSIRLTLAVAVVIVALVATSQSPPMARGTMMSSQKVALVPNAAGQGCCAGTMPTSGTVGGTTVSFSDFQFTDLAVASVNAANLAAFDTLVLLQVDTAGFTSQQKADINAFVDGGGKLIIYDSDATNGVDYSWLVYPFSTHPPCPNCGLFGGTLTVVEDNTLSSSDPASPYYINTSEIPPNTDAVGDANVVATSDPNWFGDMEATNARGQTGWTHTYAESPSGKGVLIYNGIDSDYIGSSSWSASGIDWLAKIWYLELKQQWDPTALPGGKPIAGQILLSPLSASLDTGQTHTATARVSDALGGPLFGAEVTFTVTGANPTSGTDNSDSQGRASFSYVGTHEGRDTIVASATIGGQNVVSNAVHADWTRPAGFSFAVITDLHIGRADYLEERLSKTVDWINDEAERQNIRLVVVLGDISNTEKGIDEEHKRSQLEDAKKELDRLDIPYVPLIGNHDIVQDRERRCRQWVLGRWCVWWEQYATAADFEHVFPDQLKEVREQLPEAENLESNCGTPSSDGPPDLQDFSFTYRGVKFVGLDFVSRLGPGPMWALGVAHGGTLDCLEKALTDSDPDMPVILLSHHPLLRSLDCVDCFSPNDLGNVLSSIAKSRKSTSQAIADLGGHHHGYPEIPTGYVFNANREVELKERIRVAITEATMVGSNEVDSNGVDKGFIRIVTVDEDGKLSLGKPQGDSLPAFNPSLRQDPLPWLPYYDYRLSKWHVRFYADVYTNRCGSVRDVLLGKHLCSYDWQFGDGTGTRTDVGVVTHDWAPGTYTVCVVVTDDPGRPERAERTCTKLTLQPRGRRP